MFPPWLDDLLQGSYWHQGLQNMFQATCSPDKQAVIWGANFPDKKLPNWMNEMNHSDFINSWINSFLKNGDGELKQLWLQVGGLKEDPEWLQKLLQKQENSVARVFILTGNVNDYAFNPHLGYMPIRGLLNDAIKRQGRIVFNYSLSNRFGDIGHLKEAGRGPEKLLYDFVNQRDSGPPQGVLDRIQQDFRFIDTLIRGDDDNGTGVCIIIEHAEMLFPPDANELERNVLVEFLLNWAVDPRIFSRQHQVVLLSEVVNDISNNLKSQSNKIEIVNVDRPQSMEDRLKFLTSVKATTGNTEVKPQAFLRIKEGFKFPEEPRKNISRTIGMNNLSSGLEMVAEKASGLNYLGLEDLLLQTRSSGKKLSIDIINQVKGDILQTESAGLLELIQSKDTFENVGGFEATKSRLEEISKAMLSKMDTPLVNRTIPMGIMFLGPPGTGKTLIAKAFANVSKTNFVKLGDFRSMWVGESERNLSKALELIRSLSPVVIFMDEIDQSEGSRGESGDSGVGKRIFSKLLQFMSETSLRGKVLWIAASNRPDLIDAALKRAGRFDMTIPFFLPGPSARRDIFKIHLKSDAIDSSSINEEDWDELIKLTRGFTGAELEVLVNEGIRRAILAEKSSNAKILLEGQDLLYVLEDYAPTTNRDMYYKMMALALKDITFTNTLPQQYKEIRLELVKRPELLDGDNLRDLAELFKNID
jgi:SpoVK/Ycf46/Vps4 family AAA+-type ATPase